MTLMEKSELLAGVIGCHPGSVYRAIRRRENKSEPADCGPLLAAAIHHASNGEFPAWEMRPDLWQPGQIPPRPQSPSSPLAA